MCDDGGGDSEVENETEVSLREVPRRVLSASDGFIEKASFDEELVRSPFRLQPAAVGHDVELARDVRFVRLRTLVVRDEKALHD